MDKKGLYAVGGVILAGILVAVLVAKYKKEETVVVPPPPVVPVTPPVPAEERGKLPWATGDVGLWDDEQ